MYFLRRDDNCDLFGTNCTQGIRPTTYAIAIAIAVLVSILASCFFVRRRRLRRDFAYRAPPSNPSQSYPMSSTYRQPPPPPVYFEPAPPYDANKAPSPTPDQSEAPSIHPPPASASLQYPPPSYAPAPA